MAFTLPLHERGAASLLCTGPASCSTPSPPPADAHLHRSHRHAHLHRSHRQRRRLSSRSTAHDFGQWRSRHGVEPLDQEVSPIPTPILNSQKVLDRLYNAVHDHAYENDGAFFSSEVGGIITNAALMVLHMDDHMVHRGHGVAEAVHLSDGFLYQLPQHFERFKASAAGAGLALPAPDAAMMRIILDTAAASKKSNGLVKFWLSAGRGGFGLSNRECLAPSFFVLATSSVCPQGMDRTEGWTACASPIPPKPAALLPIISNGFLESVVAKSHAEQSGYDVGVFVDDSGHVLYGPNANFAILTQDDVLVSPPEGSAMEGFTLQNLLRLIPEAHRKYPDDVVVKSVERRPIPSDEVPGAKEAMLIGSSVLVMPLVSWNGRPIGDGEPGTTALALASVLELDMTPREFGGAGSPDLLPVPYGYVSGMRSLLV